MSNTTSFPQAVSGNKCVIADLEKPHDRLLVAINELEIIWRSTASVIDPDRVIGGQGSFILPNWTMSLRHASTK